MGGELKVRSTVGQGSEFWFDLTLPVAQAPELDESSLGQDLPTGKALAACGANVVVSIHIRHCWRMNSFPCTAMFPTQKTRPVRELVVCVRWFGVLDAWHSEKMFQNNRLGNARTHRGRGGHFGFAVSSYPVLNSWPVSQNQRSFEVRRFERAVFAHFSAPALGYAVQTQTIFARVDFCQ